MRPALGLDLERNLIGEHRTFCGVGTAVEAAQKAEQALLRPHRKRVPLHRAAAPWHVGKPLLLMDLSRRVVRSKILTFSRPDDGPRSLAELVRQGKGVIRASGIDPRRLAGAGVAVTGTVDRGRGILVDAPYLGWKSLDIAAQLQRGLGIPVVVDRIADALLMAEVRTGQSPISNAMLFNIGFGMSAAFLVAGNLARGAHSLAGQIGHLESDERRRICSCGRKGCLNAAASGWAALTELGEIHSEVASAAEFQRYRGKLADLLNWEREGELRALDALHRVGQILGRTIRRIQVALDPDRVYLSGPVGRAASFADGVRQGVCDDLAQGVFCSEWPVANAAGLWRPTNSSDRHG